MGGRLRRYILEGNGGLGRMHDLGGHFTGDDLAEQTVIRRIGHTGSLDPVTSAWDRFCVIAHRLTLWTCLRTYSEQRILALTDEASIKRLRQKIPLPLCQIPLLEQDVHDAASIATVSRYLIPPTH